MHALKQRKKTTFPGDTSRLLAQTNGPLPYNRYQVCLGHFQVARETKSVLSPQCAICSLDNYEVARETKSKFVPQNSPIVQFATTPTQAQA